MRRRHGEQRFMAGCVVGLAAIAMGAVSMARGQIRSFEKPVQRKVTHLRVEKYFLVSASPTQYDVYNGLGFFLTIAAKDSQGNTITNYTGRVTLNSQDTSALLINGVPNADMRKPVSGYPYTFTSCSSGCDNGVHTFEVLINSGISGDVITVTDPSGMSGQSLPLTPNMPANDPLEILLENPANPVAETAGFPVVVAALTPTGQVDASYTGTVAISSSTDPGAEMNGGTPISSFRHTFTTSANSQSGNGEYDNGRAVLTLIPQSKGQETYTVTDVASGQSASLTVQVGPAPVAPAGPAPLWRQVNGQSLPLNETGTAVMGYDSSNRRLVLLGGFGSTWVSTNDGASWQALNCGGPDPAGASVAWPPQGEAVVFGGTNYLSQGAQSKIWVSDNRDCFHELAGIASSAAPMPRAFASMAPDPATQQVVLFGGAAAPGNRNGVWTFSANQWQRMTINGPSPAPRQGAMFAPDEINHRLLLFGGWDGKSSVYDDTWELDTRTWTWQQMHPQHQPPASYEGNMQWDDDYGGDVLFVSSPNSSSSGTSTWLWTGTDWQYLAGVEPSQRLDPSMAYDTGTGTMALEGGWEALSPPPTPSGFSVQGQPCPGCRTLPETTVVPSSNPSYTTASTYGTIVLSSSNLGDTWDLPPRSRLSQVKLPHQRYPYGSGVQRAADVVNAQAGGQAAPAASRNAYRAPATGSNLRAPAYLGHAPYTASAPAGASATLTGPPSYVGHCPATIDLKATVTATYAGLVQYRLQSSLQLYGPLQRVAFRSAGSQVLTLPWTVTHAGADWVRLEITSPSTRLSNSLRVEVTCR